MGLEQLIVNLELLLAVVPARGTVKTESDNLCWPLTVTRTQSKAISPLPMQLPLHPHTQNTRTDQDNLGLPPLQTTFLSLPYS